MRWRVLVSAPYAMPVIEAYRSRLEAASCEVVVAEVRERLTEEQLLPLVKDIDGAICGDDQFTERVMLAAPRLRVLSKWGTGIDSLDQEAAKRLGVRIYNTPGAFSEPVADTVLGYILLFARQFAQMDRDIREGRWIKRQLVALRETTLGVIGVGDCGRAVVRRAVAFGMRVLGTDIVEIPADFIAQTGTEMVPLREVLARADFVSVNCTLNSTSFHLIGEHELALMKATAYLINAARGPIVDEAALIRALAGRQIAGAGLDVFESEPLPPDGPLRKLDNCWLAAHNANSSPEAATRVHDRTIGNLIAGLHEPARRDAAHAGA